MSFYLGIDVGGSSIKGVLADDAGNVIKAEQVSYKISHAHVGWAEQDAGFWWEGAKQIVKACLSFNPQVKHELKGIMICGMVPNLVPVDKEGHLIRPAILYRDNRAVAECTYLNETYGTRFNMQDIVPKWYWLKNHEPGAYEKIKLILNTHSYIAYKLTGKPNQDADTAYLMGQGTFSAETGWNGGLLSSLGLSADVLPPCVYPCEVVGNVTEDLKKEFGLMADVPVFAGNGDSLAAMLGAGAVHKDDAMIYLGTAATMWYTEEDFKNIARGLFFNSGKLHFAGNALTGGELARWFVNSLQLNKGLSFSDLEDGAKAIEPGSNGLIFVPHLMGKRTPEPNPLASGAVLGLSPTHTAMHVYRALMEGVAYNLYDSYKESGKKAKRLVITGGGAQSPLWRQIIANVFNMPVEYYVKSDGALGVAYFAGYSMGRFKDFDELRYGWLGASDTVEPENKISSAYAVAFEKYVAIDRMLRDCYKILNGR